jgi:hypothetical protein
MGYDENPARWMVKLDVKKGRDLAMVDIIQVVEEGSTVNFPRPEWLGAQSHGTTDAVDLRDQSLYLVTCVFIRSKSSCQN